MSQTGQYLDVSEGPWRCVLDKKTHLTWENKSDLEGPHYAASTYSWFDPVRGVGTSAGGSCLSEQRQNINCDTSWLIRIANSQRWCGRTGWRLPTRTELLSLIYDTGYEGDPQIAYGFFQHTGRAAYWTSDLVQQKGRVSGQLVHFQDKRVLALPLHSAARVRLVTDTPRAQGLLRSQMPKASH